ncbi:hypothetical protein [Nocardia sp. alder85J]|uniref:hypothetical protein n=1 Tax=Nocardia sp. alder85J TaxID=2862949 RepID=UPI001CD3B078|nr:hypothetical protein [Nocardia sp. alder85J]MCX4091671.1 hypothetical protein [Nocardia sp. alder85J]
MTALRERLTTAIARTGEYRGGLPPVTGELRTGLGARELADASGDFTEFPTASPTGRTETIRAAPESTYVPGRDLSGTMDVSDIRSRISGDPESLTDPALGEICRLQGYDRTPLLTDAQGVDSVVAAGGREFFRGVTDPRFAEEFKSGPYFPGRASWGIASGNGTYVTTAREVAQGYADGDPAGVIRMALRPDARITHYDALAGEHADWVSRMSDEYEQLEAMGKTPGVAARLQELDDQWWINEDIGRFAASRGYDAYDTGRGYPGGGDRHWVVLNRSALVVER